MANEVTIIELINGGEPVRFTVADGATIDKGDICVLSDPRTAAASTSTSTGPAFAGIAAAEKVASDGSTSLALYTKGIFDMTVNNSVAVTAGALVSISGANLIKNATEAEIAAGGAIGKALEAGAVTENIAVAVGIY